MKHIARIAVTTALALAGAAAHAQYYVEGAYNLTKVSIDDPSMKLKPSALTGFIGYGLHPNLAVEGMLALGASSDSAAIPNDNVDLSVKYKSAYGVYLKPRFQATPDLELFARLGYLKSKVEYSAPGYSETISKSSTSWGLGGNYAIDKQLYLTASYMNLSKKDGVKVDGFSLGVGYKF